MIKTLTSKPGDRLANVWSPCNLQTGVLAVRDATIEWRHDARAVFCRHLEALVRIFVPGRAHPVNVPTPLIPPAASTFTKTSRPIFVKQWVLLQLVDWNDCIYPDALCLFITTTAKPKMRSAQIKMYEHACDRYSLINSKENNHKHRLKWATIHWDNDNVFQK